MTLHKAPGITLSLKHVVPCDVLYGMRGMPSEASGWSLGTRWNEAFESTRAVFTCLCMSAGVVCTRCRAVSMQTVRIMGSRLTG